MTALSFDEFAEFIQEHCFVSRRKPISQETQFERDLGLTGDDGVDLLDAVAKRYEIEFTAESFDLQPNEYLFNGEGIELIPLIQSLFGKPLPEIRTFTVGELYEVSQKELMRKA